MNITIDNYEAFLLDYLDGKLSPDEVGQLQAFVTARGMDWGELTEALPHLEAPQMEFARKERLKKKGVVVPLYVKIASAAAAAGLLLTIGLWPEKQLTKVEPVAELKPIEARLTLQEAPLRIVPKRAVQFTVCQPAKAEKEKMPERTEVEAVSALPPIMPQEALATTDPVFPMQPDLDLLRFRLEAQQSFAYLSEESGFEEEMPHSWIGRGIYRMTEGRHSSIGGLINAGLHIAKKGVVKGATDVALTAYSRADEHFEESKERWQEKHGE